jgi:hypothetical protein
LHRWSDLLAWLRPHIDTVFKQHPVSYTRNDIYEHDGYGYALGGGDVPRTNPVSSDYFFDRAAMIPMFCV